jgi:hypothetical protein
MASTTFSGPVTSTNGFVGALTGAVTATTVTATSVSATGNLTADSGTAPAAGGMSAIQISSTANLGIFVGSGAPTVTAAQGSLYLRTDGTTTNDRIYVRGSAAWIAITTAS